MTNKPASFTFRLLAYVTEHAYYLLISMIFILLSVSKPTLAQALSVFFLYLILILFNPLIIYNSIVLTHYYGGSLGKLLTGLQVTNENGAPLTPKRITFRQTAGYSFSWLVFGLGFASIAKDSKKQGWHDKAVGSLVVIKQNLWPLAAIVCIASLAGSAYLGSLVWKQVMTGPLNTEVQLMVNDFNQKANAEAELQISENDTAWKTYKNTQPGFEMKYPSYWDPPVVKSGMVNFYHGVPGINSESIWVVIFYTYLGDGDYPRSLPEFNARYTSPPGPITTVANKTATKIRNLEIDGVQALQYEEIDRQTDTTGYSINYQFVKDNYMYHVEFSTVDQKMLEISRGMFDPMIKSFRFTEKNSSWF